MAEVVQALEGNLAPMQCFTEPATSRVLCNHELDGYEHCATKLLWTRVQGGVSRALEQTTLAELVEFAEHGAKPAAAAAAHAAREAPGRAPSSIRPSRRKAQRERMADLEIQNLPRRVEGKEILKGVDLAVSRGEVHALMGPNGSGKSTLANTIMGHPSYEITEGKILFRGQDVTEAEPGRAGARGPLHGLPVPLRDPRRVGRQLPAHRDQRPAQGARRGPDQPQGVPQGARGPDGAARRRPRVHAALPQRGLLRRREEALRDPADGDPQAGGGGARRDRLGPRHRRAAHRRERRQRDARPGAGRPHHHPLPAHPRATSPPTSCTSCSTAAIVEEGGAELAGQMEQKGYDWVREKHGEARKWLPDVEAITATATLPALARRDPRRLPGAGATRERQAARLRRQRRDVAEAGQRDRGDVDSYYRNSNANIHRSMHQLATEATELYEGARTKVAGFVGGAAGGDRVRAQRDRGDQPRPLHVGARAGRRRRHGR